MTTSTTTYRERREARAERLREWASKRETKAEQAAQASSAAVAEIPFGQPILVGHHSQRRHERTLERGHDAMRASWEHSEKARDMESRADNIEAANAEAIYDDDPDAKERLAAKIARLEAGREEIKAHNVAARKANKAGDMSVAPLPSYTLANLGQNITRLKIRLANLERGPVDRFITARFDSACSRCGATLHKGGTIRYAKAAGARCRQGCEAVA